MRALKYLSYIVLGNFILVTGCSIQRKANLSSKPILLDYKNICDTIEKEKSVLYSRVNASFNYGQDEYEARLSMYYIPDSVFIISIVNTGFELFRAAIYTDTAFVINRMDKLIYVLNSSDQNSKIPMTFSDIELLISNYKVCKSTDITYHEGIPQINKSSQNIKKIIRFGSTEFCRNSFEFYHKKSGEYIVGERIGEDGLSIYGNFLIGQFKIKTDGGIKKINEKKEFNFNLNTNRYTIIHL